MATFCPNCGAENRDTARFCIQCAAPMTQEITCPSCGAKNPANARFCLNCATPLRGATPPSGLTGLLPTNSMLSTRYVIVKRLGKGGMGAVYQASDTRITGKLWAIKEMSDAAILDPREKQQARNAFQREAQMLALLDHPNLPKVNDFFTEGGKLYLVMDFIDGQTLDKVLEASPHPLPEAQVLEWASQLCDVLDYLHRCTPPIIFRDLKPGNIMLDRSNRVKLIDFGVARLFKAGQARDTANFGTAGYAPPEQYGKGQTDARSDVYALGVTLHQLLTRYDPALTPFNLPPARAVNPAVSIHVEQAIVKATQPLQVNRYQRTMEFKAALLSPQMTPVVSLPQPAPVPTPVKVATPYALVPALGHVIQPSFPFEPEMIVIPAGEFLMGSDPRQDQLADADEQPQHRVYLDEYAIGKYPVTQAQYLELVKAANYRVPGGWDKKQMVPPTDKLNHPAVNVDWKDAVAYCKWLAHVTGKSYHLPTEAEWEKAARGTDGRLYPWGNNAPDATRLNFDRRVGGTTEVGKYSAGASLYGTLDMVGNTWEWAADWYGEKYYANSSARNPTGPKSGNMRVLRGGGWAIDTLGARASFRGRSDPDGQSLIIGFRVACSIS